MSPPYLVLNEMSSSKTIEIDDGYDITSRQLAQLCMHLLYAYGINRGSYMSAYVLPDLLNKLRKRDKMRGLPSILSTFGNEL